MRPSSSSREIARARISRSLRLLKDRKGTLLGGRGGLRLLGGSIAAAGEPASGSVQGVHSGQPGRALAEVALCPNHLIDMNLQSTDLPLRQISGGRGPKAAYSAALRARLGPHKQLGQGA